MSNAVRVVTYIRHLDDFSLVQPSAERHGHMGAIIAEAILQAGLNFRTVVEPRIRRIRQSYPEATTTADFLALLHEVGVTNLLDFHGKKPERVIGLALFFEQEQVQTQEQLRTWLGHTANQIRLRQIKGVGPKTVDYLQMLTGIETAAIDRHLVAFLEMAGVRLHTYDARKQVIVRAAALMRVEVSTLDYSIWLYMAERSRRGGRSTAPERSDFAATGRTGALAR